MERISICVFADDPISQAGMMSSFRPRPEVLVVERDDERVAVAVVVADTIEDGTLQTLRSLQRRHCPALLVVRAIDDAALAAAVEAGLAGLVRRADATPERLAHAVCSIAKGDGTVPPDLLGRLLAQVGRVQRQVLTPRGFTLTGLAQRELEILRLIADGMDTAEIATRLSYSERTVKNVLHDVTSRLQLRNRSHAVAYALKQGMI